MINVPYTLESSQCSQGFSESKVVDISGPVLSVSDFRFQCRCRSHGCLQLHCHSQKLSPSPLPLYPMNFLHCSRSRAYSRYFSSLPLFLLKHLGSFLFLITPLLTPNFACPSWNVFNVRGLVTSSLCGSSTYSTSSAMFVTGIMRLFRSNCPRGAQNRISLRVAMLCNKSEARSLDTAWVRLLKTS